ncbi:MAG: zinc-binding alcohol dehydrogenase [Roseivirga sp.]
MITSSFDETTASQMSVPYMKGDLNSSFTYGYSLSGKVIEGPDDLIGRHVHLLHPHQDYAQANISEAFTIPESMDLALSTLASNMETAVNAVWDGQVELGHRVMIVGYGIIGALIAAIIKEMPGVELCIVDNNPRRAELAKKHGFETLVSGLYDLVYNTSSHEAVIQMAFENSVPEAKIIELSWYGSSAARLLLGRDFHWGRKQLISSQVSSIPLRKQPGWTYYKRKQLVFGLLARLKPDHLITKQINFTDTPAFYDSLRKGDQQDLGVLIKY